MISSYSYYKSYILLMIFMNIVFAAISKQRYQLIQRINTNESLLLDEQFESYESYFRRSTSTRFIKLSPDQYYDCKYNIEFLQLPPSDKNTPYKFISEVQTEEFCYTNFVSKGQFLKEAEFTSLKVAMEIYESCISDNGDNIKNCLNNHFKNDISMEGDNLPTEDDNQPTEDAKMETEKVVNKCFGKLSKDIQNKIKTCTDQFINLVPNYKKLKKPIISYDTLDIMNIILSHRVKDPCTDPDKDKCIEGTHPDKNTGTDPGTDVSPNTPSSMSPSTPPGTNSVKNPDKEEIKKMEIAERLKYMTEHIKRKLKDDRIRHNTTTRSKKHLLA
ncbi:Hypothetical protein CINCED_3A018485 [Cinara cedri]|uniref:Uncharacterized protein n=1 Tax=Cinara cedri TaxID=506608 RepID=A0A5E4MTD9_9HEMI|nr:Hypothetical protein CINCED_3A018485 [Cinara cedri]